MYIKGIMMYAVYTIYIVHVSPDIHDSIMPAYQTPLISPPLLPDQLDMLHCKYYSHLPSPILHCSHTTLVIQCTCTCTCGPYCTVCTHYTHECARGTPQRDIPKMRTPSKTRYVSLPLHPEYHS